MLKANNFSKGNAKMALAIAEVNWPPTTPQVNGHGATTSTLQKLPPLSHSKVKNYVLKDQQTSRPAANDYRVNVFPHAMLEVAGNKKLFRFVSQCEAESIVPIKTNKRKT